MFGLTFVKKKYIFESLVEQFSLAELVKKKKLTFGDVTKKWVTQSINCVQGQSYRPKLGQSLSAFCPSVHILGIPRPIDHTLKI